MKKMLGMGGVRTILTAAAAAVSLNQTAQAGMTFNVGGSWDTVDRQNAAAASLTAVCNRYNAYGDFGSYNIYAYYNAGIPTAQASYLGSIGFGGTWPNERVTLHESNHYLGSGTWGHTYGGPRATALIQQFDGVGATISTDGTHYWPYGMNYDNEWSEVGAQRNIALMYAFRADWGIGSNADPAAWASTSVTLTASDASGESGFNYGNRWSDNTFAHPNADYSTGAYSLRTPQGYPGWTFAGKSLTVNPGGSLLFNSWGTTGVVTINSLTLAGGTVRHDQNAVDLFQLAGNNIQLIGGTTSTFDAANGNINVLSALKGAGGLIKIGASTLTLNGSNAYSGSTAVNVGTLSLGSGASLAGSAITVGAPTSAGTFLITGNSTVGTSGSSAVSLAAVNGTLTMQGAGQNTLTINSATAGATVLTLNGSNTIKMDSTAAGVDSIVLGAGLKASAGLANTLSLNLADRPSASRTSTLISAPGGFTGNGNFTLSVTGASTFGMTLSLDNSDPTALKLVETIVPAPSTAYFVGNKGGSWIANAAGQGNFSSNSAGTTLLTTLPANNTDVHFQASNATAGSVSSSTLDSAMTINSLTIDGIASGAVGIAAGSNGLLTLSPATSATGLTVNNGAGTVTFSAPVLLGTDQTWTTNSTRPVNISSVISGSKNLTRTGSGTMTLSGASSFTGNVIVNAGTLNASNSANVSGRTDGSFGNPSVAGRMVTINSGATVAFTAGNILGSGGSTSGPALSFVVNQGGLLKTASANIGGAGGGDANIFGNITLNGGTFTTGNGYSASYPAALFLGTVTVGGTVASTINTNASNTTANGISMANAGTTFDVAVTGASGADLTVSAPLVTAAGGAGGSMTKTGAGAMLLTASNTFNGYTYVNGGSFTLNGASARLASGLIVANGAGKTATATLSGGASITTANEINVTNLGGTGTLNVLTGSTLNANSYLTVGRGIGATNAANSTLNVNGGTVVTDGSHEFAMGFSGNASNSGVTNIGYGTDGTTVGTITSASETWIGDEGGTGTMNVNSGGILNANNWLIVGRQGSVGTLNIAANAIVNKNSTYQLRIAFSYSTGGATGVVNQTGGTFTSAVPLIMAGSGADSGTYNLNGGIFSVPQVARGAGTATFNFNGGALQAASGASTAFISVSAANVRNGGAIIDTNGQNLTLTQVLRHSTIAGDAAIDGGLTKNGTGTLTLAVKNSFTGNVLINNGTLQLTNTAGVSLATPIASYDFNNLSGNTVINAGSGGTSMNGTLNANGGTGSINTSAGPGAGMGALILNGTGTTVDINSGVTDLGGTSTWTVSAWIKTTQAGATLFNKGNGSAWNSGYSTFYLGDGTDGGAGGVPDAVRWGGGWLAGSTPVNDGSWHLLTYTNGAGTKSIYVDGQLNALAQNQFNNVDTGTSIRIGFAANPGDGPVTTNGSLSGINFYNLALTADQIQAMYNRTVTGIPSTAGLTIAAGATLDLNGVTQQISSLSGPSGAAVLLGAGQLTVATTATTTFAGAISGTGSFIKSGAGALTLGGPNTYTGPTSINQGLLAFNGNYAGTINSGTTLTVAGAGVASVGGTVSFFTVSSPSSEIAVTGLLKIQSSSTANASVVQKLSGAGGVTLDKGTLNNVLAPRVATFALTGGAVAIVNASDANGTVAGTQGASSGVMKVNRLSIDAASRLDLSNNALVIPASGMLNGSAITVGTLRAAVLAGRGVAGTGGATWSGAGGIGSGAFTLESANSLGYVWNADPNLLILGGISSVNSEALGGSDYAVKFTRAGDANLDGIVDNIDVGIIGLRYLSTLGNQWYQGDFNYDGVVNNDDVAILGLAYAPSASPLSPSYQAPLALAFSAAAGVVPEPSSLGLLAVGATGLFRRRIRRR